MNRPTLATALSSSIPPAVGMCSDDISRVASIVNEAQDRLLLDPLTPDEGWWGGWASMAFNVFWTQTGSNRYAYITTPREVARIIALDVCQRPSPIRNGFYEFLEFSPGLNPATCPGCRTGMSATAFERDNVSTLMDFTGNASNIRLFASDPGDYGKRVLIRGLDQNSKPILSMDPDTQQSISGEYVTLASPFAVSLNQFEPPLTGIDKEVTLGPVTVFAVDPYSGATTQISSMEPNEKTSSYRRYLLNGLPSHCCNTPTGTVTVNAQVKLEFIPVISPADYLFITCIPALVEEVQAIRLSRMDAAQAPALEAKHHTKALQLLNGQLDHFQGKVNTAIRVPIFGSQRLRPNPV